MKQDERAPFVLALQRARVSAYAPGEFVEQESFMRASEIRPSRLEPASHPGSPCSTSAAELPGPGGSSLRSWAAPIWASTRVPAPSTLHASARANLPCRFEVSRIPPIPPGPFDVVLLLETMLAFADKGALLQEISRALTTRRAVRVHAGGGLPLTTAERESMPDADTVWLTPLQEMLTYLKRVGLVVRWQDDCSRSHREVADSLISAFAADATEIAEQIGHRALDELLAAHRLWSDWLRDGRVRKFAFVSREDVVAGRTRPAALSRLSVRRREHPGGRGGRVRSV